MANKTGNRLVIPLSLVQATRMIARGWKAAESLAQAKFRSTVHRLTLGRRKICEPYLPSSTHGEGLQMRTGIGIAVVVAIGLIWSVAVMSQWVPVASPEMKSAALIQPHEANRH